MEPLQPSPSERTATPTSPELHPGSRRHLSENYQTPPKQDAATSTTPPPTPSPISPAEPEAVDLRFSLSPEQQSSEKKERAEDGEISSTTNNAEEERQRQSTKPRLRSILVKPNCLSYRDAVVGTQERDRSRREKEAEATRKGGWTEVKARYWWRRSRTSTQISNPSHFQDQQEKQRRKEAFAVWFRKEAAGRCFNCLARDHKVASCRDPPKCIACFRSGHKAWSCRSSRLNLEASPATAKHRAGYSKHPHTPHLIAPTEHPHTHKATTTSKETSRRSAAKDADKALVPGATHLRPSGFVACVKRSASIDADERRMTSHTLLAVAVDAQATPPCQQVLEAACAQYRLHPSELEVAIFAKATFLLSFGDSRKRQEVLSTANPLVVGRAIQGMLGRLNQ